MSTSVATNPAPSTTTRVGWFLHWLARMLVFAMVMPYALAKLGLGQMGQADYPELLITLGEKSPMGLLWTFMGFSPVIQFLAGLVEFIAGVLVLWRRTAWIGGLIGFLSLGVVWLLNMTFDVPVKDLSALQALLFLAILAPWLPRLVRFVVGKPTAELQVPQIITSERVHQFTRFFPALVTVLALGGAGYAMVSGIPRALDRDGSALSGVYAVSGGSTPPNAQLVDDTRWSTIAFGSYDGIEAGRYYNVEGETPEGDFHGFATLRRVNGDLQFGFYTLRDGGVTIQLTPPMTDDKVNAGPRGPVVETLEFALESETDGDGAAAHTLVPQEGEPVILTPQLLGTTLLDQPFTWRSRPLNR